MPDFLLLIGTGGTLPETAAEESAAMERWDAWFAELGAALKDGGNPTIPETRRLETDGSVSADVATVTGYTIITADSLEAAAEMARGCPALVRGSRSPSWRRSRPARTSGAPSTLPPSEHRRSLDSHRHETRAA